MSGGPLAGKTGKLLAVNANQAGSGVSRAVGRSTGLVYSVWAAHPSEESLARYLEWLSAGHVEAVIRGGATGATIVRQVEPDALRVEVRYHFADREAFDRYVRDFAPALRAEGLALFGPGSGVVFDRSIGILAEQFGVQPS